MTFQQFCKETLLVSILIFFTSIFSLEDTEKHCEVCIDFLTKFSKNLVKDDLFSEKAISDKFIKFCESTVGPENRLCYYTGALEESPARILTELSKPLSWGMPVSKVCERLFKRDSQICEIRHKKPVIFSKDHLLKLKVSEIKNILNDLGHSCDGCVEKADFVNMIMPLKPNVKPADEL